MRLDLHDIQGNIVPGFNKDHQAFVLARFGSSDAGQRWIATIRPEITPASEVESFRVAFKSLAERKPHPSERDGGALTHISATWVNLALSFAGLRMLPGIGHVSRFSPTFRTNQVPGADQSLGHRDVHALLIVAADQPGDLEAEIAHQCQTMGTHGVSDLVVFRGATLPRDQRGHEHFGFKDGISQPRVSGTDWGIGPEVASGEFILHQPDQTSQPSGTDLPAWTRNGSFLAFVQLQQHVATFWKAMRQQAQQFGVKPEDVAAWTVGREHDAAGTMLADPPAQLSHVGRAYSRWLPPSELSRHRIIRRGIPYGVPWVDGQHDDGQRGLLFVAYQANIVRQFEHVWGQWLNGPDHPVRGAGRDALVGQPSGPGSSMPLTGQYVAPESSSAGLRPALISRPDQNGGPIVARIPAFVTPRYGGYFYAPSISALSVLAGGIPPTPPQRL